MISSVNHTDYLPGWFWHGEVVCAVLCICGSPACGCLDVQLAGELVLKDQCRSIRSALVDDKVIQPSNWFGSVLCVSFTVLTLLLVQLCWVTAHKNVCHSSPNFLLQKGRGKLAVIC